MDAPAAHPPPSSGGPQPGAPRPFAAEVRGLPVVACATFLHGKCSQIVCEGTVPEQPAVGGECEQGAPNDETGEEASKKERTEEMKLLSNSIAAAERSVVPFLAEAAKAAAAGKEDDADTIGNDQLGLDDD
ncbi:hypothetical protein, conserved [Eimeria praecox]|uniref:Uncharacterized protein n=1 Tax=Eimeria praecox TaxID=51316 RepID=U6G6N9_9EIME|nr:hypothetical protein, conserved [Eimeria praecox]